MPIQSSLESLGTLVSEPDDGPATFSFAVKVCGKNQAMQGTPYTTGPQLAPMEAKEQDLSKLLRLPAARAQAAQGTANMHSLLYRLLASFVRYTSRPERAAKSLEAM